MIRVLNKAVASIRLVVMDHQNYELDSRRYF